MSEAASAAPHDDEERVDNDLYSRQIYAIGLSAMKRMLKAHFCIVGCSGTGAEIAKNIVLSGVNSVRVCDSKTVAWEDMASNCFATEDDHGKNRAEVTAKGISPLNPSVTVRAVPKLPTLDEIIDEWHTTVCIFVNAHDYQTHDEILSANEVLRAKGVKTCYVDVAGIHCRIANDFGDAFIIEDPLGEEPHKHCVTDCDCSLGNTGGADDDSAPAKPAGVVTLTCDIKDADLTVYTGDYVTLFLVSASGETTKEEYEITKVSREHLAIDFNKANKDSGGPSGVNHPTFKILQKMYSGGAGDHGNAHVMPLHKPVKTSFSSLRDEGANPFPKIIDPAFSNLNNRLFKALYKFQDAHAHARPTSFDPSTRDTFLKLLAEIDPPQLDIPEGVEEDSRKRFEKEFEDLKALSGRAAECFSFTSHAELSGVASFVGGVASQEALKAVTGKFQPIDQTFTADFRHLLQDPNAPKVADCPAGTIEAHYAYPTDWQPKGNRWDGNVRLFGKALCDRIMNEGIFVVGSGAIGCEYLKNLALSGFGCGPKGKITVTDNDSIERSNLSRQFLFRNEHIGKNKSECAAQMVKATMVKQVKIRALTDKIWRETTDPVHGRFNNRFWAQQGLVLGAVDNVAARQFVDDRCVEYQKSFVDSGTLGTAGHVCCFVPGFTGRFRDTSAGSDEKKIPFCTLHFFPTNMDHCVQFARDFFAFLFSTAPTEANRFLSAASFDEFVASIDAGARNGAIRSLYTTLVEDRPKSFKDCVVRTRLMFESSFVTNVKNIVYSYPADATDEDNKPFWSGSQRMPKVHEFDPTNENHANVIGYTSRLLALVHRDTVKDAPSTWDEAKRIGLEICANEVKIPAYVPEKVVLKKEAKKSEEDVKKEEAAEASGEAEAKHQQALEQEARAIAGMSEALKKVWEETNAQPGRKADDQVLSPDTFEKDDETNGHVQVVAAIANVRAAIYSIPQETEMDIKKIAGKIIPAMITTTAAVTGLATIMAYGYAVSGESNNEAAWRRVKDFGISLMNVESTVCFAAGVARQKPYFVKPGQVLKEDQQPEPLPGSPTFTCWDVADVHLTLAASVQDVCDAVAAQCHGLEVLQLVEAGSGKWIIDRMSDAPNTMTFPLAGWTRKFLEISEDDMIARGHFDYTMKCRHAEKTPADSLPVLRFSFGPKRRK